MVWLLRLLSLGLIVFCLACCGLVLACLWLFVYIAGWLGLPVGLFCLLCFGLMLGIGGFLVNSVVAW